MLDIVAETRHHLAHASIHDTDFHYFRKFAGQAGLFVDIGGNRGQSIISMKAVWPECRIASFEPLPQCQPALQLTRERWPADIEIHNLALGARPDVLPCYIPVVNGEPYLEQATLSMEQFARPWIQASFPVPPEITTIQVPVATLDSFQLHPDVIKIDNEGYELRCLKGAVETINRSRPVVMVENNDWGNVTEFMKTLNYKCYRYLPESNTMVDFWGQITNAFYRPA